MSNAEMHLAFAICLVTSDKFLCEPETINLIMTLRHLYYFLTNNNYRRLQNVLLPDIIF